MDAETQDKYLFICVDSFTKYAFARALPDRTATSVELVLLEMLRELPRPKSALSDNGSEFTAAIIRELLKSNSIIERHGLPYRKETNGGAERIIKTLTNSVLYIFFCGVTCVRSYLHLFILC